MKKTLVVLLILAVAGGAFAQEVTFSGEVVSGVLIQLGDGYEDPVIRGDDDDDDRAVRARLNAEVDGGNWGAQLGIAADFRAYGSFVDGLFDNSGNVDPNWEEPEDFNAGGQGANLYLYNAHAWGTIADMFTIRAGLIDPGVWTVGGWVDENISSGLGLRFEIHPIEGLNIGAFIPAPLSSDTPPTLENNFSGRNFRGDGFGAGFSYAQEGLFEVSAGFGVGPSDSGNAPADHYDGTLIFGAGYYGVENLSVYVGLGVYDLIEADDPTILIGLNVGYDVTPELNAFLEVGVTMFDGLEEIWIDPGLTYAVSEDVSVGFDVGLTLAENPDEDLALKSVEPFLWAQYGIGNAFVKFGYGFTLTTEDFAGGDSSLDHKIGLWFGASF